MILALVCWAALPAAGQDGPAPFPQPPGLDERGGDRGLAANVMRLIRSTRQLGDWSEHHGYLMDALRRVYEQNGWDSEPDQFSLELMETVESLPPWDVGGRFDAFVSMIGDRYLLDGAQEDWLRRRVMRESMGIFQRNMDRIMQYAPEIIATRAGGEPISPEQVARWADLATPVIRDAQRAMNRAAADFLEQLDPEQRDLAAADLAAANRRVDRAREGLAEWREGRWTPAQWGLQDDPIQNRAAQPNEGDPPEPAHPDTTPAARDAGQAPGNPTPPRDHPPAGHAPPPRENAPPRAPAAPADARKTDDPWAAYVRGFIERYKLNADQQQQAWRIFASAAAQRDRLSNSPRSPGGTDPPAASQPAARRSNPTERLFEQLKARLDRIPTRAQRTAAERP